MRSNPPCLYTKSERTAARSSGEIDPKPPISRVGGEASRGDRSSRTFQAH